MKGQLLPAVPDEAELKFGSRDMKKRKVEKLVSAPNTRFEDVGYYGEKMLSATGHFYDQGIAGWFSWNRLTRIYSFNSHTLQFCSYTNSIRCCYVLSRVSSIIFWKCQKLCFFPRNQQHQGLVKTWFMVTSKFMLFTVCRLWEYEDNDVIVCNMQNECQMRAVQSLGCLYARQSDTSAMEAQVSTFTFYDCISSTKSNNGKMVITWYYKSNYIMV